MSELRLSLVDFAGWARAARAPLPYPIDIADVPGSPGDRRAPSGPVLDLARSVFAAPRLSVFAVWTDPNDGDGAAAAVADSRSAVLVVAHGGEVRLRAVPDSELVTSIAGVLPDLPEAAVDPVEVAESDWTATLAALATPSTAAVAKQRAADPSAALERAGIRGRLAELLRSAPPDSIAVGTLGAMVWPESTGSAGSGSVSGELGAGMASWHRYPDGTLLARRNVARRGGDAHIEVGGFRRDAATRALGDAVAIALYRPRA